MENKINITELLKDCKKGTKLYSPLCGECRVLYIYDGLGFDVICGDDTVYNFSYDGRYNIMGECCIFPSKENRDWSKFQRPFKDGDIIYTHTDALKCNLKSTFISIFKEYSDGKCRIYVGYSINTNSFYSHHSCNVDDIIEQRLATEEEKAKLFQAIKDNGYKWNEETKTLEKLPKFKVGDKITDRNKFIYRITEITDKGYKLHDLKNSFITFEEASLYFVKVVDVFDIATLVPFESRVLVRSSFGDIWRPAIYGFTDSDKYYMVGGLYWKKCIPYNEETKHLLGTTNDCDEFYKTWE